MELCASIRRTRWKLSLAMELTFQDNPPSRNISVTDWGNLEVSFFLRFRVRFVEKLINLTELQRCKNNVNSRSISIKLVAKS